ncbi:ParA family protein [Kaistella yonginensis]|uniref:ParA family protein n=1 Tax=Kaistella yonginensis TaxID=658267 RepID=UPI0025B55C56|nr:ParA family protein [Kaistella yonginensis]MDN3607192.1 ParA family protein [Kaistella yonginensis]
MSKIILITHQKGGVGKSTITYNLAVNLKDNAKVCILDMDTQGSLMNINQLSKVPIFPAEKLNDLKNSDYDFIFIDTPPYLNSRIEELCIIANVIIIPTKAGVLDLLAIKSTIDIVVKAKAENRALIVFNMVKPNTTLTAEIKDQLKDYDIKVSKNMLSDLVAFSRSVLVNGVEEHRNAQKQIDNLTKEILTLSIQ